MKPDRVAVVIPSRTRPRAFLRAAMSVVSLYEHATVYGYVDDCDPELAAYMKAPQVERVILRIGKRMTNVQTMNSVLCGIEDADWLGMLCDDMTIVSPGWGEYLTETRRRLSGGVGVVSPAHNFGRHCDVPFVTREWLAATRWFAPPKLDRFCWHIMIGLLADAARCLVVAPPDKFNVHHEQQASHSLADAKDDCLRMYTFMLGDFHATLDAINMATE